VTSDEALAKLMEGNFRFRSGNGTAFRYQPSDLSKLARGQKPVAAILACSDSRVAPNVIFDQPLGALFACRVPGNVASESARWMAEMAVGELGAPLVLVVGHSGCLAVTGVLEGKAAWMSGTLKMEISGAINAARAVRKGDLLRVAVEQNALRARDALVLQCSSVSAGIRKGTCRCEAAVYEMETGEVRFFEPA